MIIEKKLTEGCDKLSRIYGNMLSVLDEVLQDEQKIKELSPLDFSALGMYIGKFVEQEINSSVVQIMRAFRDVPMPDYYCKRYPGLVKYVDSPYKTIKINAQKDMDDPTSLKTIPLGDAFYALEQLKQEDNQNFFDNYPWLREKDFLDAWQELYKLRNRMAHIGEIIDADTLEENYVHFKTFLKYMPDIIKAKRELAPKGYRQPYTTTKKKKEGKSYYASTSDRVKINIARRNVPHYSELREELFECLPPGLGRSPYFSPYSQMDIPERPVRDIRTYNAKVFKGRNGKKGLKDQENNILVPANYDDYGFLPKPFDDYKRKSVIAIQDGKSVLVSLDGSGRELTKETYDDIRLATKSKKDSPYVYRKKGRVLWGFMDESGQELCDNIIDNYIAGDNCLWYESGDLRGFWNYGKGYPFLPPIYDSIEVIGKTAEPLLFTLKGVDGYVKTDGTFIPMTELESMPEDLHQNNLKDFISE